MAKQRKRGELTIRRKIHNGTFRFEIANNIAGEQMLFVDLHGNSYAPLTRRQALSDANWLRKHGIPMLEQYARSK